jgi:hypothetical protein
MLWYNYCFSCDLLAEKPLLCITASMGPQIWASDNSGGSHRYYMPRIQITMRALIASWRRKSEPFISEVFSGYYKLRIQITMRSYCLLAAKVRTIHKRGILRYYMLRIQITMRDLIVSWRRNSEPFITKVFSGIICLEYRLPCALLLPPGGESQSHS